MLLLPIHGFTCKFQQFSPEILHVYLYQEQYEGITREYPQTEVTKCPT